MKITRGLFSTKLEISTSEMDYLLSSKKTIDFWLPRIFSLIGFKRKRYMKFEFRVFMTLFLFYAVMMLLINIL